MGHSLKNLMQKLVLISFPHAHTHTQTESREEFYIPTGLQQTEFETGKHVMLSTRVRLHLLSAGTDYTESLVIIEDKVVSIM